MPPPFGLDPTRLYETGPDGRPGVAPQGAPEWLGVRHRLVLALFGLGLLLVGGLAGLSLAAFASGARGWAAAFALAAMLAAPLLVVGPVQDWWRFRRRR